MVLKQAPFLKIIPSFIAGILVGIFAAEKTAFYGLGIFFVLNLAFLSWRIWRGVTSLKNLYTWAIVANFLLFSLGYLLAFLNDFRHYDNHIQHLIVNNKPLTYKAVVSQPPIIKANTVRVFLSVKSIEKDSIWRAAQGEILANFALDTISENLQYGDELLVQSTVTQTLAAQNPEGLDLRTYYAVQHIYHQTYVNNQHFLTISKENTNWAMSKIYSLRA